MPLSSSEDEGPAQKRRRTDTEANIRTLRINLSELPEWIRTQTDNQLFQIFKIGVAINESITMRITSGEQSFQKVRDQVLNTQTALERKLDNLFEPLRQYQDTLTQMTIKPSSKGTTGENIVFSVLEKGLPHHSVKDVSTRKSGRCGDIHVTSEVTRQTHLVEVKKHKSPVPANEIEKFEDILRENKHHHKVGVLISLDSGISMRAKQGKFEIVYEDEQYFVYLPNARMNQDLIVWSVLLADELAALDRGLTDTQTDELLKLQRKFQAHMEKTKVCRSKLNSLKEIVDDLEKSLDPLLKVIDGAKKDLNKALHQRGKPTSKRNVSATQSQKITKFFQRRKATFLLRKSKKKKPNFLISVE